MDVATWWAGVKPLFEFGFAAGVALVLLFSAIRFGGRLVTAHETSAEGITKISVLLDQHDSDHKAQHEQLNQLQRQIASLPVCPQAGVPFGTDPR